MSRSFEKCGRLWKAAWLHNVDNIQQKDIITINVPLFKKMRDIMFFLRDYHFLSYFKDFFEGSKSQGPLKMSPVLAKKVIVPKNKKLCPKIS